MAKLGEYRANRVEDMIYNIFIDKLSAKERLMRNSVIIDSILGLSNLSESQQIYVDKIQSIAKDSNSVETLSTENCHIVLDAIFNLLRELNS